MEADTGLGWQAQLQLGFECKGDKTILSRRSHKGPLMVQRPFYPEGGLCHVYLLHPPGGVVGGDQLAIDVEVAAAAQALITTPGAGKFYRSAGKQAVQCISLQIEEAATLEWLPQEAIIFEGAQMTSDINIKLASHAGFIGWEIIALGRPAVKEGFNDGAAILNWRLFRNKEPLFLEKMKLDAQALSANWGLNKCSVSGSMFATGTSKTHLQIVRQLIDSRPAMGVTLIDDLLICRASGDNTEHVRDFFEQVRSLIRQDIVRYKAHAPRIWAT